MSAEPQRSDRLRRYLLGTLPEPERQELELELLRDDALFEEALALEDEAVHDLAQDGGAAAELAPLAERLRATPAGRRRLADAAGLVERLGRGGASRRDARPRRVEWLALAAGLLLAAGLAWLVFAVRQGDRPADRRAAGPDPTAPTAAPSPAAEAAPPPAAPPLAAAPSAAPPAGREPAATAGAPVVVALTLAPGVLRGGEGPGRLTLPVEATLLRLTLALPAGAPSAARYRVALVDDGGVERWGAAGLEPTADGAAAVVRVDLPAADLAEGDYELTLAIEGAGGSQPIADYALGILRP